jgi:hypothetical protein
LGSLKAPLQEETTLKRAELHGPGAFFVVVSQAVDPGAHGIAWKITEAGSLRVAFVIVFLVVLVLFVLLVFFLFLVWLFSKEHLGS